jgi:hypothetical protein
VYVVCYGVDCKLVLWDIVVLASANPVTDYRRNLTMHLVLGPSDHGRTIHHRRRYRH